jgi:hypothetical protein
MKLNELDTFPGIRFAEKAHGIGVDDEDED